MPASLGLWDAAVIAAKAVTYAATFGAAGAVFFLTACGALIAGAELLRIRRLVLCLALLAVFGGAAQILASAASMSGGAGGMLDGSLIGMVWQTGAGRANGMRVAGLLLAAVTAWSQRASWWSCLGAAAAATSFAWAGHARALNPDLLPILLLSVHLLGIAFWLGALLPLSWVARGGDLPRIAAAAARFGAAAAVVVGTLVLAGAALLWLLLGHSIALGASTYGRWLIFKLALVACILCLAAFNKWRLTPRLLAGDGRAAANLRRTIRFELLVGGAILAVTATFTTITGPPALSDAAPAVRGYNCGAFRSS
ncbi:MAG: copper resistance D family protein [Steroidobacteraceae bacterium]